MVLVHHRHWDTLEPFVQFLVCHVRHRDVMTFSGRMKHWKNPAAISEGEFVVALVGVYYPEILNPQCLFENLFESRLVPLHWRWGSGGKASEHVSVGLLGYF